MHYEDVPASRIEPTAPQSAVLLHNPNTGGGFMLRQIDYPPYSDLYDLPGHPRQASAYYVVSGILVISIDGRTITLKPGDSGAILPGSTGCVWNPSAAPGCLLVIGAAE